MLRPEGCRAHARCCSDGRWRPQIEMSRPAEHTLDSARISGVARNAARRGRGASYFMPEYRCPAAQAVLFSPVPRGETMRSARHEPLSLAEVRAFHQTLSNWGRFGERDQLGALNLVSPARRSVPTGSPMSCPRGWRAPGCRFTRWRSWRWASICSTTSSSAIWPRPARRRPARPCSWWSRRWCSSAGRRRLSILSRSSDPRGAAALSRAGSGSRDSRGCTR